MARLELRQARRTLRDERRSYVIDVPGFSLSTGERKAIVGRSGSGKTSVMDMLALASEPDSAERFELIDGAGESWREPWKLGAAAMGRLRALNFGYVLQTSPLFPFLTHIENARLGQQLAGRIDDAYLQELLGELELGTLPHSTRVSDLSVGQRQRLAIVRALAHRPAFVLADEPTASLDPHTADALMDLLTRVAAGRGAGVLIVTHNIELAIAHGCSIHRMEARDDGQAGAVLVAGETSE